MLHHPEITMELQLDNTRQADQVEHVTKYTQCKSFGMVAPYCFIISRTVKNNTYRMFIFPLDR